MTAGSSAGPPSEGDGPDRDPLDRPPRPRAARHEENAGVEHRVRGLTDLLRALAGDVTARLKSGQMSPAEMRGALAGMVSGVTALCDSYDRLAGAVARVQARALELPSPDAADWWKLGGEPDREG